MAAYLAIWRHARNSGAELAVKIEMRNQGSQRDIAVGRNVRYWLIADISKDRELGPLYPRKRTLRRVALDVRKRPEPVIPATRASAFLRGSEPGVPDTDKDVIGH